MSQLLPRSQPPLSAGAAALPHRVRRLWRWRGRDIGLVFIAPWLLAFLAFELIPTVAAFYYSLTDFHVLGTTTFLGLANYQQLFGQDQRFWTALSNTLYYTAVSVPMGLVLAFVLALILNVRMRGQGLFRTLLYVPAIVPSVAATIVWVWLFDPNAGLLDQVITAVGLPTVHWLDDPGWSKNALILLNLWAFGGGMVIFLAGLQGISQELYEAAAIDGAGAWRRLLRITIPLMTPSIFFNLVLGVIGSFQVFNSAYIATHGGPLDSTLFYMLYLYDNAFTYLQMGYACAMAIVLFVLVLALTLLLQWSSRRWVFYS